jgi:hypothetical protein
METGISHKSDFKREEYNSLTSIFDPIFILNSIESYLGIIPNSEGEYPRSHDETDRTILLNQFIWLHNNVQDE